MIGNEINTSTKHSKYTSNHTDVKNENSIQKNSKQLLLSSNQHQFLLFLLSESIQIK